MEAYISRKNFTNCQILRNRATELIKLEINKIHEISVDKQKDITESFDISFQ